MCIPQAQFDELKARYEQQLADQREEFFRIIEARDHANNIRFRELSERLCDLEGQKSTIGFPKDLASIDRMTAQVWKSPHLTLNQKRAGHTLWSIKIETHTDNKKNYSADFSMRNAADLQALIKKNKIKMNYPSTIPDGMVAGFTRGSDAMGKGRPYCGDYFCLLDGHENGFRDVVVGVKACEQFFHFEDFIPTNGGSGASLWHATWQRESQK